MTPGYDALEPGYTGNENDADHRHDPYVRHVHLAWYRDQFGQWASDSWDDSQWEVICRECGDSEGHADEETAEVRALRGPYPTKHKAEHAAHRHEREFSTPLRWMPGGAMPQKGPAL